MRKLGLAVGLSAALIAGSGCASGGESKPTSVPPTGVEREVKVPVWPVHSDMRAFWEPDHQKPAGVVRQNEAVDGVCIAHVQGRDEQSTRERTTVRIEKNGQALGYLGIQGQLESGKDQPIVDLLQISYDDLLARLPGCAPVATNPTEL